MGSRRVHFEGVPASPGKGHEEGREVLGTSISHAILTSPWSPGLRPGSFLDSLELAQTT